MQLNSGYVLGLWLLFRCIGVLIILRHLHMLLHTATRRKERAYFEYVTLVERYFGAYILQITDFKRGLVRFWVAFQAACFTTSCLLLCLWLADLLSNGVLAVHIPAFPIEAVCVLPMLVPLLMDIALTVYPDGHPHFRFDAYAPAIRPHDKVRNQTLIREAKASLRCTPEQFATQRNQRRIFGKRI